MSIPLATDLESLPGHNEDELRDRRFVDYTDMNTLSTHFNTCLSIDKKSFSSSLLTRQHIFKTRHNILNKIFKLYYMKNCEHYFKFEPKIFDKNQDAQSKSISSSTLTSFKTDWSVNRKSSSSYRREPKNLFHILQMNPKKDLLLTTENPSPTNLTIEEQQTMNYEQIKDILVRAYYPHLHKAVQNKCYFGSKSKFQIKDHDLQIFTNFEPSSTENETTVQSPVPVVEQEIRTRGRRPKHKKLNDKPAPIAKMERRVSEEIPPVMIQESTPIQTKVEESSTDNEIYSGRKRKISLTINTNVDERKKRKIITPPSPEFFNEYQEMIHSER